MRIVLCLLFAPLCAQAQLFHDLLLPKIRHVEGMVVDQNGAPVPGAWIQHSESNASWYETDSSGKFELYTRAPVLAIRKAGFRTELLRTEDATELRVILQKLSESRPFPVCSSKGRYFGITDWGASYQFPRISGVKASRQSRDVDYGARSYYIDSGGVRAAILHGSGSNWSFGIPSAEDVWQSIRYEEVVFDVRGRRIIDARGQLSNGKRWRYLGSFGESASYSDVEEASARVLDRVLDGACLKPDASK